MNQKKGMFFRNVLKERMTYIVFLLFFSCLQIEAECLKDDLIFKDPVEIAALHFPKVEVVHMNNYKLNYITKYDENNAHILANFVNTILVATYKKPMVAQPLPGYEIITPLYLYEGKEKRLFGLILIDEEQKHLIIVYRGTQTAYEWELDKNICPEKFKNGAVVQGFYTAFLQNRNTIHKILRKYEKVPHVWVAGHSIGAAVATITTQDIFPMILKSNQKLSCYTFGCPRVLDEELANEIEQAVNDGKLVNFRLVNVADAVPSVPPAATTQPFYQHTIHPIFFQYNGKTSADNHAFYLREFLTGQYQPLCPFKSFERSP